MIIKWTKLFPAVLLALALLENTRAAAPATAQGLISAKGFYSIAGTAVANLTNNAKFPNSPDAIFFPSYFEWNATGDIGTPPGNFADNYGSQILGYFYPPSTGDYIFRMASDDNGVLFLSTDSAPANKRLIAQETVWSNAREYFTSGGASDLLAKDSSTFAATQWPTKDAATGGAKITLQAGRAYYIEALAKEGGGGDFLSVSVQDPGGLIDPNSPIPGQYLSSDRDSGAASIATPPQNQTVDERGSVTFRVTANGTPPYTYQWRRGGTSIPDATNLFYTLTGAKVSDNNTKFSVVITGGQGNATSTEANLTVTPDTVRPTILASKGSPSLTEVVLTFSEPVDQATATTLANYQLSSASGNLNVTAAALAASGTQVTLTTAQQTLGTKYTLLVNNVKDTAATANTIAANTKSVFFPTGKLVEINGFVVFEAENFNRNLDNLWLRDTARGIPSGGASMVNPNGTGGSESATKLEYDVEFKQAGIWTVWYRASGNDGGDDSGWFHLDGERPVERATGNQASMTGFQPQADFVWRSDAQDPPDPFTVEISSAGLHVIGLARREDGSFFDKFILTTNPAYSPTGFGPPETREGAPGLPTASITAPTAGQTFATGGNIPIAVNAAGSSGLNITRVQYTANGNVIGESTTSPFGFTWSGVAAGVYGLRATSFDEIGQAVTSDSVAVTVGTPPPQALLVVGTESDPNLNAADAGVKARLETNGWQVTVVQAPASRTADGDGKQLIVVSSTVNSGDVGTKFRASTAPVVMWEQAVQDDFLMTLNTDTVDRGTTAGQTQISIVRTNHPLAAGLGTGLITTTTAAQDYSWGVPNTNAIIIATLAADAGRAAVYGYDKGAPLIDGSTAPARRVLLFSGNGGFAAFTDDAKKLFDAAVQWASGISPAPPKTSAKIAWVSFHSADGTPSGAAATAGFTKAADVGYTDLLKASGHSVTRFVTTGAPDTNVLNAFDLVIISRSAPSGDYQDPPETAAWNGLTAKTMILGGYVLRQNRLGFSSGNTIPDTTGSIKLTVNDTNHAIFAGVPLDGTKTMVNNYGDIMTYNGVVQRGISVNTDAVAGGGTVLATVGTATDPTVGAPIIIEWKAGATLANATANRIGGDRLVFLTGSRENNGLTSEGAGIFDLTADGAKLFVNAVNYLTGVKPGQAAPTLAISRSGNNIVLTFTGTLQSAGKITGPWTDVPGASSPLTVTPSQAASFYRARQ